MTAAEFVEWVLKNAARVTEYSNGGDGSNGKCDCIGLVIGAWRMSGNKWPWVHGSNYAARYLTENLQADSALHFGDLVYKARPPGTQYYNLPDSYKNHPDKNDYYHVGVVTNEYPLEIVHCTSVQGGIKVDDKRGQWKYSGQFSELEEGGEQPMAVMTVTSKNGKPVNLRKSYTKTATVIAKMPVGSTVELMAIINDDWARVKYGDKEGYCMREFLTTQNGIREEIDEIIRKLEELKERIT